VIDMAILHGTLPQGVDRTYTLQVPDLMIKDLAKAATTLQGVTQSLVTARTAAGSAARRLRAACTS
jgi:hypothetical protein